MLNNPHSAKRFANGLVSALYVAAAVLLAILVYAVIRETRDTSASTQSHVIPPSEVQSLSPNSPLLPQRQALT